MLARYAFLHRDFVFPLQLMLHYYEQFMRAIFGWAEPLVVTILRPVGQYLSVDLHLMPHWKHVFVLLWLYFGTYARVYWRKGEKLSAAFSILLGGILALMASAISGSLGGATVAESAAIFFVPILAMIMFEYGISAFNLVFANIMGLGFRAMMKFTFVQFVLPQALISVAVFGTLLAALESYPLSVGSLGLVGLAAYSFIIALYWILRALRKALRASGSGIDLRSRILQESGTRIGLLMLSTLLGAVLFVAANAGLVLLGI